MALISLEKGTRVPGGSPLRSRRRRILSWLFTKRISSEQRTGVQRPGKKANTNPGGKQSELELLEMRKKGWI